MVQRLWLCTLTVSGMTQSLVREQGSQKPCGSAKKKPKKPHLVETSQRQATSALESVGERELHRETKRSGIRAENLGSKASVCGEESTWSLPLATRASPLNILADTSVLVCLGLLATVQSDKETLMGPLEELDSRTLVWPLGGAGDHVRVICL